MMERHWQTPSILSKVFYLGGQETIFAYKKSDMSLKTFVEGRIVPYAIRVRDETGPYLVHAFLTR